MRGLGRYFELNVQCRGQPDPATGLLINIKHIDEAVRRHVLAYLQQVIDGRAGPQVAMGTVMQQIVHQLADPLKSTVEQVELALSRFHSLTIRSEQMERVTLRQQFEFSAAHRLHVNRLSPDENRRIFGKCNNPSGHGHNYRLDVAVEVPIDPQGHVVTVDQIDELVNRQVIQKLDHKHLNVDVAQFAQVNPSVENIAKVVYGMLLEPVEQMGARLQEVSVWETSKTVCTYRGPGGNRQAADTIGACKTPARR